MATKRTSRIDPNAAFQAIVRSNEEAGAPQEAAAPAPVAQAVPKEPAATAKPQPAPRRGRPAAKKSGPMVQKSGYGAIAQELPEEEFPEAAPRLVQKGYYLTEEQTKKLGLYAVLQDTDRSAIVRAALDMYFEAHRDVLP